MLFFSSIYLLYGLYKVCRGFFYIALFNNRVCSLYKYIFRLLIRNLDKLHNISFRKLRIEQLVSIINFCFSQ